MKLKILLPIFLLAILIFGIFIWRSFKTVDDLFSLKPFEIAKEIESMSDGKEKKMPFLFAVKMYKSKFKNSEERSAQENDKVFLLHFMEWKIEQGDAEELKDLFFKSSAQGPRDGFVWRLFIRNLGSNVAEMGCIEAIRSSSWESRSLRRCEGLLSNMKLADFEKELKSIEEEDSRLIDLLVAKRMKECLPLSEVIFSKWLDSGPENRSKAQRMISSGRYQFKPEILKRIEEKIPKRLADRRRQRERREIKRPPIKPCLIEVQ